MASTLEKRRRLSSLVCGDYLLDPRPGLAAQGDTGRRNTKMVRKFAVERGFVWREVDLPVCCSSATAVVPTKIRQRHESVDTRVGEFAKAVAVAAYVRDQH